ncbi:hypothetical protein [Tetragenococcus halophilus]|uniref:hypothetical protein n=1 Tax=Tetragenococcus halophilus TaxID=51669 RepID=UPI00083D6998|nr:hypothetical protein [Tetragenococcus halophilus]AOF48308.1 hypothetical protein AC806_02190 [Tetragenococcus halophilus]MCO8287591.1 hypothetical protein [Tetragenococcus halophilus]GLL52262.1 hypothetical protein YA5_022400 [Tetragenococcus halophilus]
MDNDLKVKIDAISDPEELKQYLNPLDNDSFCQIVTSCADQQEMDTFVPNHKFPAYTIALHCLDQHNMSQKQRKTIQNIFLGVKAQENQ